MAKIIRRAFKYCALTQKSGKFTLTHLIPRWGENSSNRRTSSYQGFGVLFYFYYSLQPSRKVNFGTLIKCLFAKNFQKPFMNHT